MSIHLLILYWNVLYSYVKSYISMWRINCKIFSMILFMIILVENFLTKKDK